MDDNETKPMIELAPIVLFVYNRPWHTEQTLAALAANELADQSTLYIYADGPKNSLPDTLSKIKEVREVIHKKKWCKKVIVIEREGNFGLADSIKYGVTEIVNQNGKIIVLEDDIITSPSFLRFMNEGLEYYQHIDQVAGISGFSYQSETNKDKVFFLPIGCSWGWATWKRQWDLIDFNSNRLIQQIDSRNLRNKMNFGGYKFYEMLADQNQGKINSWAIRFYASFFLQQKSFVYPPNSLVENIGFGDEATHTKSKELFFSTVEIGATDSPFRMPQYDDITDGVYEAFKKQYGELHRRKGGVSLLNRVIKKLRKIL